MSMTAAIETENNNSSPKRKTESSFSVAATNHKSKTPLSTIQKRKQKIEITILK
jgi:hypothetical protein